MVDHPAVPAVGNVPTVHPLSSLCDYHHNRPTLMYIIVVIDHPAVPAVGDVPDRHPLRSLRDHRHHRGDNTRDGQLYTGLKKRN